MAPHPKMSSPRTGLADHRLDHRTKESAMHHIMKILIHRFVSCPMSFSFDSFGFRRLILIPSNLSFRAMANLHADFKIYSHR